MNKGKFKEGFDERRANGRPKGAKNKYTNLKNAFLDAFEKTGGVDSLVKWAKASNKNRGQFYKILAKMLPSNVTVENDEPKPIRFIISDKYRPKKNNKRKSD